MEWRWVGMHLGATILGNCGMQNSKVAPKVLTPLNIGKLYEYDGI